MQTKTLSERIAEIINIKKNLTEFYSVNELKTQAAEEKKVIDEYAGLIADRFILGSYIDLIDEVLPLVTELQAKNAALLAKNKELEEEVGMEWNWAEMAKEIKRGIITTDKLNKQGE